MSRAEKAFTIFYWVYVVIYIPCFLMLVCSGMANPQAMDRYFPVIIPFHILGMLLGIPMLIILFRDIYKRQFPSPNSKVTWTILMLMFWPSIPVYLYRYGFHPRTPIDPRPQQPPPA